MIAGVQPDIDLRQIEVDDRSLPALKLDDGTERRRQVAPARVRRAVVDSGECPDLTLRQPPE